jgi:hypothetical protein
VIYGDLRQSSPESALGYRAAKVPRCFFPRVVPP